MVDQTTPKIVFDKQVKPSSVHLKKSFSENTIWKWGIKAHDWDISLLNNVNSIRGGYVAFAGDKGGFITREGILSNGQVSFDKVRYVKQLENNLLSASQICDKKYRVLFDDSSCYILKQDVTIPEDWILMSAPRKQYLYV
ncbi:hypothetical protein E3N88_41629 [Mikania micrantha]|uniref:Uncharacterized protein n=1 Tax=Mikania micrantha TaxID=192012 RepID=A0A5N6LK46_9ASTR|nr:hypothetical protein E3N88_41629 [Mikania micrantha]